MRTAANVWPRSASLNPKSAAAKVRLESSSSTRVASVPVGGVFAPTLTVTMAVLEPPFGSTTV